MAETRKPKRPCTKPGCRQYATDDSPLCTEHQAKKQRTYDRQRKSSNERGYGSHWQRFSRTFRERYPLCGMSPDDGQRARVGCLADGVSKPGDLVDHVIPTDIRPDLFYAERNLQTLCRSCHAGKTRAERMR